MYFYFKPVLVFKSLLLYMSKDPERFTFRAISCCVTSENFPALLFSVLPNRS